jgi:hypothetical protein
VGGKGAGQRFCQSNGIYFAILEGSGMAVAAEFLILDMHEMPLLHSEIMGNGLDMPVEEVHVLANPTGGKAKFPSRSQSDQ